MRSIIYAVAAGLSLLSVACGNRSAIAYGEANSIIVAAPQPLWDAVEDTVLTALEPRIFTVRDERAFNVTHVAPADSSWAKLRLFRQVLVIGQPEDPWVAPVLERRDAPLPPLPAIVGADDLWARGQRVTAVVLPTGAPAERLADILPELSRLYDARFRTYVYRRMFVSGQDSALSDTLRADAGFSLLLPKVYEWQRAGDAVYHFWNDNEGASQILRSVLVAWRPGVPPAAAEPGAVLAWRDTLAAANYDWAQTTDHGRIEARPVEDADLRSLEVHGIWRGDEDGLPVAGPFIAREVVCPAQNRTYLLDAWLYAPGEQKYEYMLQLQTILDSFACGE